MQDNFTYLDSESEDITPTKAKILVVDDEPLLLRTFKKILESEDFLVDTVEDGKSALEMVNKEFYDMIIADLLMPVMDGIELLREVKKIDPELPFIIVTGHSTVSSAVTAMKLGAVDYITKPIERPQLILMAKRTINQNKLKRELRFFKSYFAESYGLENMVGKSRSMLRLFSTVKKVARSEATIFIEGESGTGKELLAKSIHNFSSRREHALVTVDCGSLPLQLLQSELFGHVKGAFTGAMQNRRGLFEEARGGTIFLDEIGEIPSELQLSLLRVLQEREIRPVGSDKAIPVDVRVISASNRNLKQQVEKGDFRRDLYYRLAVIRLTIPPLRMRKEDIPALSQHFLNYYNKINGKSIKGITSHVMNLLLNYQWEGNVRELENVIERAVVLAEHDEITADLLPEEISGTDSMGIAVKMPVEDISLKEMCSLASSAMEKEAIMNTLKKTKGNKKKAAELLGISRGSLYNKIKTHNIK